MEMEQKDPGDSKVIADDDPRLERALERGIGEICLRPENCHEEIREPVRSISEVRTLVAPDDRLQTLTYVEEVGGFVNRDGTPYISDYEDVHVNILGTFDPILTPLSTTVIEGHVRDYPRLQVVGEAATALPVCILRTEGNDVGVLDDGTAWNGNVRFRWDAQRFVYHSEGFLVTLNRVAEFTQFRVEGVGDVAAIDSAHATTNNFRIYVKPIVSTRASNGNCFMCRDGLTNDQVFVAPNTQGTEMQPFFDVDVLGPLPSSHLKNFQLRGCRAVRIKVGGHYAFYGPLEDDATKARFFERAIAAKSFNTTKDFSELLKPVNDAEFNGDQFTTFEKKFGNYGGTLLTFALNGRVGPILHGPMNSANSPFGNIQCNLSFLVGMQSYVRSRRKDFSWLVISSDSTTW